MTQEQIERAAIEAFDNWRPEEIADVQRLRLEPGDTLVLLSDLRLSTGHKARIQLEMSLLFPENRVLVLDSGTRLTVLGAGE